MLLFILFKKSFQRSLLKQFTFKSLNFIDFALHTFLSLFNRARPAYSPSSFHIKLVYCFSHKLLTDTLHMLKSPQNLLIHYHNHLSSLINSASYFFTPQSVQPNHCAHTSYIVHLQTLKHVSLLNPRTKSFRTNGLLWHSYSSIQFFLHTHCTKGLESLTHSYFHIILPAT